MTQTPDREANWDSSLADLDRAVVYRQQSGGMGVITMRDRCPVCRGVIRVETDNGLWATFTRLHMECVKATLPDFLR